MYKLKVILLATMILGVGACAPKLIPLNSKSYEVGQVKEMPVGSPMIEVEKQKVEQGTKWVGRASSFSGYEERISSFKQELIYGGKVGRALKVIYREYRDGFARWPFFQELQYDLAESSEITFKNFRIQILEADNSRVKFKVLAE